MGDSVNVLPPSPLREGVWHTSIAEPAEGEGRAVFMPVMWRGR